MSGLRILAEGRWPGPEALDGCGPAAPAALPPLPGFTASSFNPLVAETAERCLRAHYGPADAPDRAPSRTALLLASGSGDRATARAIDAAAASGRRVPPLLFFQSNPNAVLGLVAARWQLTGPVVAVSPLGTVPGEVPPDALELAALLLADGDADQVLVIAAEQTEPADQPEQPGEGEASGPTRPGDTAVALLVTLA
ncbi:hypothetical protein OG689_37695 [Kitasatospora sp. NBC_00240]|uniref:hypothetical protein n=1 Tax=Kitasatospora sp. NBC_00240 TaxID=2903567 RepID=UPI0022536314|nr:hypothetical protein [Kitasatospora sp. NBC_00240]MCX5214931.1 hypothetical protein [Kitasatospora sp. NBC_00240]